MSALVPGGTVQFDRRVMCVEHVEGQTRLCLAFSGGEACVMVDTVVGCDGIKGVTTRVVLEMEYPEEIVAKYCRTYVYRNIVPMQEAKRILGSYADNAKWFMGEGRGGVNVCHLQGRRGECGCFHPG